MSFSFGSSTPAQPNMGFGTPAKTGFGTGFSFGSTTPATSASTGFGTFGSTFGTPASTAAAGFGTSFGTPATSANTGFGTTFGTPASTAATGFGTSFGTPATSAATGFGTFGNTSFGTPATTTSANLFSGFGTTTTTAAPAFSGFGTGTPLTTGFGTANTSGFGTGTGFGTGATTGFGAGTSTGFGTGLSGFGGFGTGNTGFGTSFGAKPPTTTGFGSFGSALAGTVLGQQQLQQPGGQDPNQAIFNSINNCSIFGDERDAILAKWNLLQAWWGTGKGYYSASLPPVDYTQQNPYCRFKAIGYSVIPGNDNKEGLVAIVFNKKESDVRPQKAQLLASLATIMGNKPNLTVNIHDIRSISDSKSQVLIFVQEKGITGSVRKIPATDLASFLLQPMQKQQLVSLGTDNIYPHVLPDSDQLAEYLSKPPTGVDIRIWKQAQLDNPNPEKYIPAPLIGFEQLKWRSKCQEKETVLHKNFMEQVAKDISELKRRHAASTSQIAEQKRKLLDLQHRVLQILVKQEITRKAGMALQPEEEVLKGQLENMQTQINVPTQFKGRLNELLSQIRMQNKNAKNMNMERYNMEPAAQEDIKQFLRMEQNGINHLVDIINADMTHLKTIRDGMQELIQRQ